MTSGARLYKSEQITSIRGSFFRGLSEFKFKNYLASVPWVVYLVYE